MGDLRISGGSVQGLAESTGAIGRQGFPPGGNTMYFGGDSFYYHPPEGTPGYDGKGWKFTDSELLAKVKKDREDKNKEKAHESSGGLPNNAKNKGNADGRTGVESGAQQKPANDKSIWDDVRSYLPEGKVGDAIVDQLKEEFSDPVSAVLFLTSLTPAGLVRRFGWKLAKPLLKRLLKYAKKKGWFKRNKDRTKRRKKKEDPCEKRKPVGNPTEMPTGVGVHTDPDFTLPGLIEISVGGGYRDDRSQTGPLGRGRICDLDATIMRNDAGGFTYRDDDNTELQFPAPTPIPDGWVDNGHERFAELMQGPRRSLLYREKGLTKHFDKCADGVWRIRRIEDRRGNAVRFDRDAADNLISVTTAEGLTLLFEYDASKLRTGISLEGVNGVRLTIMRYAYDGSGNLTLADCPFGERHEFSYDANNRLVGLGRNGVYRAWFRHDAGGRRIEVGSDRGFAPDRFEYDDDAKVISYLPQGDGDRATRYHYDAAGDVTRIVDALGHERQMSRHPSRDQTVEVDGEGAETIVDLDAFGNPKTVTDAEGRSTYLAWNEHGQIEIEIDNAGASWDYDYDSFGSLERVKDPLGHVTEILNNAVGLPIGVSRQDGLIEQRAYDERHRLTETLDFRGGRTRYERDGFGRIVRVIGPAGDETKYDYDDGGGGGDFFQPVRTQRADGSVVRIKTSQYGRRVEFVDGEGRSTVSRYDAFDNLVSFTDANDSEVKFQYDDQFQLCSVVNQLGRQWTFERDAAGRVVRESDFDGRSTTYGYDKADRVVQSRVPDGRVLSYVWDRSSLLLSRSVAAPGEQPIVESFRYDDRGLLCAATNAASTVELEYDSARRVTTETLDGVRIENVYDCCGNRTERRIGDHLAAYGHDPFGALTKLVIGGREVLVIERDVAGREMARRSAEGFRLDSAYDAVGRIVRQTVSGGAASEGTPGARAPSGWSRRFSWDSENSPTSIADPLWGATSYECDPVGQVVVAAYGDAHEGAPPLLMHRHPGSIPGFPSDTKEVERFAYAPTLNVAASDTALPQQPLGRPLSSWTSSVGGRVEEARGPNGERIVFTYDENGRATERHVERDGFRPRVWRFAWDGFDRMTGAVCPDGACWGYLYDAFGRRTEKRLLQAGADRRRTVSLGSRFLWDGDVVAAEIPQLGVGATTDRRAADLVNATWWHFEPGGFTPLLRETARPDGDDRVSLESKNPVVHYVIVDHLGTPRELVDAMGKVEWSASYRLWGGVRGLWTRTANDNRRPPLSSGATSVAFASEGSAALDVSAGWGATPQAISATPDADLCPIRFQGQWADVETDLHYNRFRTYDPASAQYLSPDPIGIEGGYRQNGYVPSPISFVDAFGLRPCSDILKDIFNKTKDFHTEMLKYDSVSDARGGFPSYRSGRLKLTKPGGHYNKLNDFQRGISNDLDEYAKSGCYKCASKTDMLKIAAAGRVVGTKVPLPTGTARRPLPFEN